MLDVVPKCSSAEANFGKRAGGGSDHSELRRRDGGEEFLGAWQGDDIVDVFDFGALHPFVFGEMDGRIGVREEFLDGSEAGASVSGRDGVFGIKIVLAGPAHPDASDGGSGINEDAVHVEEEGFAGDEGHVSIVRRFRPGEAKFRKLT